MTVFGIFVKHPVPGRVKTRLGAEIGDQRAASLYAAFVADLADRFRSTAKKRFLGYAPHNARAADYFRTVAEDDYDLWPQPDVTLGERMQSFFEHCFSTGARRVVLIGSDSPTLPADFVEDAFSTLKNRDVVLGPSTDGGYYLIGQRSNSRPIFDSIDWSSSRVLAQTVARIADLKSTLGLLGLWYDVDTVCDLELLRSHEQALRVSGAEVSLKKTGPLLRWDTPDNPCSL